MEQRSKQVTRRFLSRKFRLPFECLYPPRPCCASAIQTRARYPRCITWQSAPMSRLRPTSDRESARRSEINDRKQ
jgi:hypothetical protein